MSLGMEETTMHERISVAVLGLGAMGSRMASRLASDDVDLRVWSRSGVPEGCASLGPILARSPAAAVEAADFVIAMLSDDDASRAVWLDAGALKGMRAGATVVDCSTLSPSWTVTLAEHAAAAGLTFR